MKHTESRQIAVNLINNHLEKFGFNLSKLPKNSIVKDLINEVEEIVNENPSTPKIEDVFIGVDYFWIDEVIYRNR
jgi:hypothetical protein